MKGIIKSQLYKLKSDKIIIFSFGAILLIAVCIQFMIYGMISYEASIGDSGGEQAIFLLMFLSIFSQLFICIFTSQFCGADFLDKTCNYEIMSGHTRAQVYFGRTLPCVIIGTLGAMIIIGIPIALIAVREEWGKLINVGDFLMRYLLMALPIARIISEYIFLSFIIRNPYIIMGISYGLTILVGVNIPPAQMYSPILGMSNLNMLTGIDTYTNYTLMGDCNYIYETALSSGDILKTITFSLIFIFGSLLLGFAIFKNDDLN